MQIKISSTKSNTNGIITSMLVDNKYNIYVANLCGLDRDDQDFYSSVGYIIEDILKWIWKLERISGFSARLSQLCIRKPL